MTNFIPIFPLDIVVYPGETLNLHIFEPRYKEMIGECLKGSKPFGLPPVVDGNLGELGTLVEITELVKEYDNGEMDVRTRGVSVFRMLQVMETIPDKQYQGAIVTYPGNRMQTDDSNIAKLIVAEVRRLYALLNVQEKFPEDRDEMASYEIGHFVGFSRQQEYEMLGFFEEIQRLEYIRRHLASIVPVIRELEEMKERIKRNGHFRDLSLGA